MKSSILIIGLGSAGKRHLQNLVSLDAACIGFDPRKDRCQEASELEGCDALFAKFDEALKRPISGAVIASPPAFHVDQIQQIRRVHAEVPILCEKPLSTDASIADNLGEAERAAILLGYTYRWWPPLQEFRRRIQQGQIGDVRHVRCVMSAHLADWHPWERYQDFFMSSKEQGGGALLDESHILDLVCWIFGIPDEVTARVEKLSSLDISTDDNVDMLLSYPEGPRISIHLDLYARPHERQITAVGEGGTLRWSYEHNALEFSTSSAQDWQTSSYQCERNDMFMGVARDFLRLIDGELGELPCSVKDGLDVLRIIEAARYSAESGRTIALR